MKPIKQLLRQPMKTLSGIILVALAVAILCVCVGQAAVAANMANSLDDVCTSSALTGYRYVKNENNQVLGFRFQRPEAEMQWIYDTAELYPDIVERINRPGMASAYIPELIADNHTGSFQEMQVESSERVLWGMSIDTSHTNYSQIMAQITLKEISTAYESYTQDSYGNTMDGVSVELTGIIDSVLGLQEGYTDPTGYTARIKLVLPNIDAMETLNLEVGQQYLVFGMDYTDLDWEVRADVAVNGHGLVTSGDAFFTEYPEIEYFYWENWVPFPDGYVEEMGWVREFELGWIEEYNVGWYEQEQTLSSGQTVVRGVHLTNLDMEKFHTVEFTLLDLSQMNIGVDKTYSIPTIAKLDGSAEEFLTSLDGALWQAYLDYMKINHQSFAVIGVDDLLGTGDFAQQNTVISSGREFTDEEMVSGAKVCIISEEVAQLSGLKVGDTITLNYYSIDFNNPYQLFISEGYGNTNPSAYTYCATTEFTGVGEPYTIVGLYQKDTAWEKGVFSAQDFRVNTVFVPKNSVTGEMDYGEQGIFLSVVLHNGKTHAFETIARRDRYIDLFTIVDQNYASIQNNLHNYSDTAQNAMIIGVAIYLVLLALFLIFYPAMQRMTVAVMAKVGGRRREMLLFVMISCLGILLPGTVLGVAICAGVWDRVMAALTESAWIDLELGFDIVTIVVVAVAQLTLASLLVMLVGLAITFNKNLMNRQKFRLSIPGLKRIPVAPAGAVAFALIIAMVLCGLSAANEAEYDSYEKSFENAEVTVVLSQKAVYDPDFLLGGEIVKALVYDDRFSFSLKKYLVDEAYMTYMTCGSINGIPYGETIWGINANAEPENLSSKWNAQITWLPGYDASAMGSYSDMYLLVPESMQLYDADPVLEGTQVLLGFQKWAGNEYICTATVAGTYTNEINSTTIYCSIEPLFYCGRRVDNEPYLQHFSATVKNNDEIEALRQESGKYFSNPEAMEEDDSEMILSYLALYIFDDPLERLSVTLENSIQFNELCTMLIFALSAGAGFFLGFLMIRSRKREIILMRTLGRANFSIYLSYAFEQMLCILAGAALGGLAFQWHPIERLGIFVGIYFVGLSAALILFLNSKLLTNVKEDE